MATVYLARDLRHDRLVAVKVFRGDLAQGEQAEQFLREIQIAARLSIPTFFRCTTRVKPMASCTMSCPMCRERLWAPASDARVRYR